MSGLKQQVGGASVRHAGRLALSPALLPALALVLACGLGTISAAPALAQGLSGAPAATATASQTPGHGTDCTEVTIDYTDDPSLTPAERIAAMDRALERSLAKFDACETERQRDTAAASGGGTGGGSGTGNGAGGGGGMVSSAAGGMSGTDQGDNAAPEIESRPNGELAAVPPGDGGSGMVRPTAPPEGMAAPNGKVPDDIPPADNDSVLERQIRQAAINEPDPEVRARLWNEYRRYKGLPPRNETPAAPASAGAPAQAPAAAPAVPPPAGGKLMEL